MDAAAIGGGAPGAGPGCVVSLDAYRRARGAAAYLRELLHAPAWLSDVKPAILGDGTAEVVVVLKWPTPLVDRCLPTAVDDIQVRRRVEEG